MNNQCRFEIWSPCCQQNDGYRISNIYKIKDENSTMNKSMYIGNLSSQNNGHEDDQRVLGRYIMSIIASITIKDGK